MNSTPKREVLNFSEALNALKKGRTLTREGWNNESIKVKLQIPDENSKMTEPYIYMEKEVYEYITGGDGARKSRVSVFPLDLSAESTMAGDWVITE